MHKDLSTALFASLAFVAWLAAFTGALAYLSHLYQVDAPLSAHAVLSIVPAIGMTVFTVGE